MNASNRLAHFIKVMSCHSNPGKLSFGKRSGTDSKAWQALSTSTGVVGSMLGLGQGCPSRC